MDFEDPLNPWSRGLNKAQRASRQPATDDVPAWMIASLHQDPRPAMTPVVARAMLVAYVTARREGPTPIDRFLLLFPGAGPCERELLVTVNGGLLQAEMARQDMDAVFDELETSIGADLMGEIQRGISEPGDNA